MKRIGLCACTMMAMFALAAPAAFAEDLISVAIAMKPGKDADAFIAKMDASADPRACLYAGIARHNTGQEDMKTLERATRDLEKCWTSTGDPVALAYWGSAVTLKASLQAAKGDMIGASLGVGEGLKKIDRAVDMAPDSMLLRILRLENSVGISEGSPFHRWDVIKKDLAWLEPKLAGQSAAMRSQWELISGKAARADKKTALMIKHLEASARAAPESEYAKEARTILARYEE